MSSILVKTKYSAFALLAILFMGVKCNRPETIGPQYVIAPDNFGATSFSVGSKSVNFNTIPKDTFYANFNSPVSWTIVLKGLVSGATKKISGTSQVIDGSNPSWLWDGSHDGLFFFKRLEAVEATLTFLGSNAVLKDTITSIVQTKKFKDVLVGDLETLPSGWITFQDPGETAAGVGGRIGYKLEGDGFKVVQGNRAFELRGEDLNNSYFIAGMRKDNIGAASFPTSDPGEVYLNVYIYGEGDATHRMNFGAQEDDNGNGTHQPSNEDEFQIQITLDHVGWKLFSFKYSDFPPAVSLTNGGSGNKIHEPKKITGISFGLLSNPPKGKAGFIFDFPIITFGGPFDPSK